MKKMLGAMGGADSVAINFEKAALLVIDMQQYQVREGSITHRYGLIAQEIPAYYLNQVKTVAEPNMVKVVDLFHCLGAPIIYTQYASVEHDESDLQPFMREFNRQSIATCGEAIIPRRDDPVAALVSSFSLQAGDRVLQKSRSGAFTLTELDHDLREMGAEQLVIVGVLTHACVENTARIARDLGYEVLVLDDACATLDPQLHDNAISAMRLLGIEVTLTETLLAGQHNDKYAGV